MTQQTSARRATSILEVWRHGLLDVCWHLRILHVACRTVDAYKGRPTQLLLALLNRLPKPATRSTKSKYRPPDQLDTRTHDHSISISSEPRSHITVRCDRGPDTHIFLSAFSRARVLHQRLSAHSYDQSAQLSIYQRTNTRQSPRISALSATTRSHHRNRVFFLWAWLHTAQLHACFTRRLNVTIGGLHCRDRPRKGRLRPI